MILDPDAFHRDNFVNVDHGINGESVFKGLLRNGIVICSPDGGTINSIINNLQEIPDSIKRDTLLLLREMWARNLEKQKRNIIVLNYNKKDVDNPLKELLNYFNKKEYIDSAVIPTKKLTEIEKISDFTIEVIPLEKYYCSKHEKLRDDFQVGSKPFDEMKESELYNLIKRIVQFAAELNFYDPCISYLNNLEGFYTGIKYIIDIWSKKSLFRNGLKSCIYSSYNPNSIKYVKDLKYIYFKINEHIVDQLKCDFPKINISMSVKVDCKSKFRARHLETQSNIFEFAKGFDFIDKNKAHKYNTVKLDLNYNHLGCIKNLPEAIK